jgi:hypothetical protein
MATLNAYKQLSSRQELESNRFAKRLLIFGAIACVLLGIGLVALLFCRVPESTKKGTTRPLKESHATPEQTVQESFFEINSNIGGFVGGVAGALFSLSGVFLLFLTLRNQNESAERDKIEARFFELIRIHRDNIQEILYRNGRGNTTISQGRKVFKNVYDQILEASQLAQIIFKYIEPKDCLRPEALSQLSQAQVKEYASICLSYSIVFFGVAKDNDNSTLNALKEDFKEDFAIRMISFFRLVPAEYELADRKKWREILSGNLISKAIFDYISDDNSLKDIKAGNRFLIGATALENNFQFYDLLQRKGIYFKRFGGHQYQLGHYFRHLFQTVRYIDKQTLISYTEKYDYIKTLRAQLSNYEQYVFFYNSISSIGREWEFSYLNPLQGEGLMISKYNFIKNIPDVRANNIDFKAFYPLVDFEFEAPSVLREQYMRDYWEDVH